jgi:hypothetical protein
VEGLIEHATCTCRICSEEIKRTAVKCIHCGSYQDWRAFLPFSATILSLLVALVSVSTAAIPIIFAALRPVNSDIVITKPNMSNGYIVTFVSNNGSRPGLVRLVGMIFTNKANGRPMMAQLDTDEGTPGVVIPPGQSALMKSSFTGGSHMSDSKTKGVPQDCRLDYMIINFDGTDIEREVRTACPGPTVRVLQEGRAPYYLDEPLGPP